MQVKVWNNNVHDYREKFRERDLLIKAKGFIVMDRDEAEVFIGSYAGRMKTGDGQDDPRGFKMLKVDYEGIDIPEPAEAFVCHADGKTFQTKAELDSHEEQYKDRIVKDEVAEQEIRRRGRPPKKREAQGGVSDTTASRGSSQT